MRGAVPPVRAAGEVPPLRRRVHRADRFKRFRRGRIHGVDAACPEDSGAGNGSIRLSFLRHHRRTDPPKKDSPGRMGALFCAACALSSVLLARPVHSRRSREVQRLRITPRLIHTLSDKTAAARPAREASGPTAASRAPEWAKAPVQVREAFEAS